jgi:amidase
MGASTTLPFRWDEWSRLDGTALAGLLKSKQTTPQEVARQSAAAARALDPKLNAILEIFDDIVEQPHQLPSNIEGPLYGVPVLLKDLGAALAGRRQEAGSRLYAGLTPKQNDPIVNNWLQAGLVPVGRSTTPELGLAFDTVTVRDGNVISTLNPWDLSRSPGGSSGGSAAVVSAGIVPIATSSDGGGSTRVPAAFCGLVGLKPSRGRGPRPLASSEYISRISTDGVVTRSVRDSATVFDFLANVPRGGTFIRMERPAVSYKEVIERDPTRLRVGLATGQWGRSTPVPSAIVERVQMVARLLESLGHHVEEFDSAPLCDWETIWFAHSVNLIGMRALLPQQAAARGVKENQLADHVAPMTYKMYLKSQDYTKFDVYRMMEVNNVVTRVFGRLMDKYDVLLLPTAATHVPKSGVFSLFSEDPLETWVERKFDSFRYTLVANETGQPAISVPTGLDEGGLPLGVQFFGDWGREDILLQLAAQIERSRPDWFGNRPPLHVTTIDK